MPHRYGVSRRVDLEFTYPLYVKVAKENYRRRYSALQNNETNGELCHDYSFSFGYGLYEDDFRTASMAVLVPVNNRYDTVKQYAVVRFHQAACEEIIC